MKNVFGLALCVLLLTGCGGKEKTEEAQTAGKKNYIAEGMKYLQSKDIERAIRNFDLAIKQEPTNPANYLFLGQVYLKLKNVDGAADAFEGATKVAPENGDAYFFLSVARALQGRKDEAIKSVQKSADIFMQARDEEKFKRSVAVLKSLTGEVPGTSVEEAVPVDTTDAMPVEDMMKMNQESAE
jgi:cytochrome c-type biogenesis protein CcmH/NrfG